MTAAAAPITLPTVDSAANELEAAMKAEDAASLAVDLARESKVLGVLSAGQVLVKQRALARAQGRTAEAEAAMKVALRLDREAKAVAEARRQFELRAEGSAHNLACARLERTLRTLTTAYLAEMADTDQAIRVLQAASDGLRSRGGFGRRPVAASDLRAYDDAAGLLSRLLSRFLPEVRELDQIEAGAPR